MTNAKDIVEMIFKGGVPALGMFFLIMFGRLEGSVSRLEAGVSELNKTMAVQMERAEAIKKNQDEQAGQIKSLDGRVRHLEIKVK